MKEQYKVDIYHVRCAAYIINLIVCILYNSDVLKQSICSIRDACKTIRGSPKLTKKLKSLIEFYNEKDIKVILDCETR